MRKSKMIIITLCGILLTPINVNAKETPQLQMPITYLDYATQSIDENILLENEQSTIILQEDILSLSNDIISEIENNKTKKSLNITNNIIMPKCDNYICIKEAANINSKTIAKLFEGSAANIINYENDEWMKVQSGDIIGYIETKDILQGTEKQEYIEENIDSYQKQLYSNIITPIGVYKKKENIDKDIFLYKTFAIINKETKLYFTASIDSDYEEVLAKDSEVEILEVNNNDWLKISYNNKTGYVKSDNVNINVVIDDTSSAIAAIVPGKKYDILSYDKNYAKIKIDNKEGYVSIEDLTITVAFDTAERITQDTVTYDVGGIPKGEAKEIIEYALQFLGNPYVWGGTSLTNGADCSGFVQSVYKHFGYSLPRVAADQANAGTTIPLDEVKPGDLIFYSNSSGINHVGLYIGDNKLLHASNPTSGIKISQWCYRTPTKAIRLIQDKEQKSEVKLKNSKK